MFLDLREIDLSYPIFIKETSLIDCIVLSDTVARMQKSNTRIQRVLERVPTQQRYNVIPALGKRECTQVFHCHPV